MYYEESVLDGVRSKQRQGPDASDDVDVFHPTTRSTSRPGRRWLGHLNTSSEAVNLNIDYLSPYSTGLAGLWNEGAHDRRFLPFQSLRENPPVHTDSSIDKHIVGIYAFTKSASQVFFTPSLIIVIATAQYALPACPPGPQTILHAQIIWLNYQPQVGFFTLMITLRHARVRKDSRSEALTAPPRPTSGQIDQKQQL